MSKTLKRVLTAVLCIAVLLCMSGITFGWLGGVNYMETSVDSSVLKNYFESGTGTQSDPFIIHTPRQLYNLAWLQYMGQFNKEDSDNPGHVKQYYFELCDGSHPLDSSDTGIANDVLDMTDWTLPPIGTPQYPFVGHFDGKGITIANLGVSGTLADLTDPADDQSFNSCAYSSTNQGCDIVGLFGVIGTTGSDGTVNGHTYSSAVNSVANFNVDDITVKTQTSTSLIGIVAGYVNGTVEGVGVIDSNVVIANGTTNLSTADFTSNISDWATVGHVEDEFLGALNIVKIEVAEPEMLISSGIFQPNAGDRWGGSISMDDIYQRVDRMLRSDNAHNVKYTYVATVTKYQNENGVVSIVEQSEPIELTETEYTNLFRTTDAFDARSYKYYTSALGGTAVTKTGNSALVLIGGTDYQHDRQIFLTVREINDQDARYISDGVYFLNIDFSGATPVITDTQTQDTGWILCDSSGTALTSGNTGYLRYRHTDDSALGYTDYYLTRNGNNLTLTSTASTTWTLESDHVYSTSGSTNYYITHVVGVGWTIETQPSEGVYIKDSASGQYLTVNNNGNGITKTANKADASTWIIPAVTAGNSTNQKIYSVNGNNRYYLRSQNNTLTIGNENNGTSWNIKNTGTDLKISYGDYQLTYENNNWTLKQVVTKYAIAYSMGELYMYLQVDDNGNLTRFSDYPESPDATLWSGISGEIYTAVGNTRYYLNRGSVLERNIGVAIRWTANVSTSSGRSWRTGGSFDSDEFYFSESGTNHLLMYNTSARQWQLVKGIHRSDSSSYKTHLIFEPHTENLVGVVTEDINASAAAAVNVLVDSTLEPNQYTITEIEPAHYRTPDTIIPLVADDIEPFNVGSSNTGYIISGTYDPEELGDIRVGEYSVNTNRSTNSGYYDLTNALNYSLTYNSDADDAKLQVLTITYKSNGVMKRIKDDHNKNNTSVSSAVSSYAFTDYSDLDLRKYADSRDQLKDIFVEDPIYDSGNNQIFHCIHFVADTVDMNHLVTAPYALINNTEYTNGYTFPEDCIDCNLKERGYINFFASTCYEPANYFFSLYEINRDADHNITSIKHISKIYGDPDDMSKPYIYQYQDGTWSSGSGVPASPYTMMFNVDWIEHPNNYTGNSSNMPRNAMYYFEVPVNAGEYALGGMANGYGAYLIYLDISTTKQLCQIETVTDYTVETTKSFKFPKGIQVIESAASVVVNNTRTINEVDSAAVALAAATGTPGLNIYRSGNTVTVTSLASGLSGAYAGYGITLQKDTSPATALTVDPYETTVVTTKTVMSTEYNLSAKTLTTSVATTKVTTVNGTQTSRVFTYTVDTGDGNGPQASSAVTDDGAAITVPSDKILSYEYSYVVDASDPTVVTNSVAHSTLYTDDDRTEDADPQNPTHYTIPADNYPNVGSTIVYGDSTTVPTGRDATLYTDAVKESYLTPYAITIDSNKAITVYPTLEDYESKINNNAVTVGTPISITAAP